MKIKKVGIIVSVILIVLFSVFTIISHVLNIGTMNNYFLLLENICIGIVGSSFVTLYISISEYCIMRKNAICNLCKQVRRVLHELQKIKYMRIENQDKWLTDYYTEVHLYNRNHVQAIEKIREHYSIDEEWITDEAFKSHLNVSLPSMKYQMLEVLKSYSKISNISLNEIYDAYEEVDFFFFNTREHKWIEENIQQPMEEMLQIVRVLIQDVDQYIDKQINDLNHIVFIIEGMNNFFFMSEVEEKENSIYTKVYTSYVNNMEEKLEEMNFRFFKKKRRKLSFFPTVTSYEGFIGRVDDE